VIFVDTNVIMYAVGRPHPLREETRRFFEESLDTSASRLCTSAEVLQELMHAYIGVDRLHTLSAAFQLVNACIPTVFEINKDDIETALGLVETRRELGARDLLHLAVCHNRGVTGIKTYDRALRAAFDK
jgi:uncharacterized protein